MAKSKDKASKNGTPPSLALKSQAKTTALPKGFTLDNPKFPKDYTFDRVDGILVTHGHFDHISGVAELAAKFSPTILGIYEVAHYLSAHGLKNVVGMNKGGTAVMGPMRATMTHAIHSSGIVDTDGKMIYAGEAAGYVLHFPDGRTAYFAAAASSRSEV